MKIICIKSFYIKRVLLYKDTFFYTFVLTFKYFI